MSTPAPLCSSLHNGWIVSSDKIAALPCLVNIHPDLPSLRGRGHGTLPILEGHRNDGATLDRVGADIDGSRSIEVVPRPMPPALADPMFRPMTQTLLLAMLVSLLQRSRRTGPPALAAGLRLQALQARLHWSGVRLPWRQLAALPGDAGGRQPRHPLLEQLPAQLWT